MTAASRTGPWLGLGVVAACVAIFLVLRVDGGPTRPQDHEGRAPIAAEAGGLDAPDTVPTVPTLPDAGSPGVGERREQPADLPAGVLAVRVVAAPDAVPVAGAKVWLLRETADSLALGLASLAVSATEGVPPAATDAGGRVRIPWGSPEGQRRLVAEAPGLLAGELRLDAAVRHEVVLTLGRGLTLAGRVVDAVGAGVRDVVVEARSVRRPRLPTTEANAVPVPGAERARGTSDGEGRFEVAGLSPGSYLVAPVGEGWVSTLDLPASTLNPLPGVQGVLAEAGARDVRLVVARFADVALQLVDARTTEPIDAPWATATLRVPGRAEPVTWSSHAPQRALTDDDPAAGAVRPFDATMLPAALVRSRVPWDGRAAEVDVEVRAAGYKVARARVPLTAPAPRAGSDPAGWHQVLLEAEQPGEGCRLMLHTRRSLENTWRPSTRMLTLCRASDGTRVHRAGRLQVADQAEFRDLPAGEATLEVWDGLSHSLPVTVTLVPGTLVEAKVEFGPLTGVAFFLRDGQGRRVFDADMLLVAREGHERGLPDSATATRLEPGLRVVMPLEPGRYRYAVNKQGVGYDAGSFTVVAGGVAEVRARLGPIQRFDTRSPARGR